MNELKENLSFHLVYFMLVNQSPLKRNVVSRFSSYAILIIISKNRQYINANPDS